MEIIEEIKGIIRAEIEKAIAGIQFPEKFDLELLNSPEIKVEMPQIDLSGLENALLKAVEARKIDIPAPDFTRLENLIQSLIDDLKIPDNTDILQALIKAVSENKPLPMDFSVLSNSFKDLSDKIEKANTGYKGGAIGPSKIWIRNSSGTVVNPANEEKQDELLTRFGEVQATPTSNTLLGRLKNIWDRLADGTQLTQVQASDSPSIDAFGRWRVSLPETLFDSKQIHDSQPLFWDDQETSGSGTSSAHNANKASTTITVGNLTAGTRVRQTFRRFNYQPGKSQLIFLTANVSDGVVTGITRRVGYFDGNNGIFFELDGNGDIYAVRRTNVTGSPVDNRVVSSSFNIDTLDGTGPSGITLDPTKTQIIVIDLEWLGVGRVRMGFVVDGQIYYAHEFLNANNLTEVYMSTPNLPLRYEISNDGTGAAADLMCICGSVISEGGTQDNGQVRYTSTANTQVDCAVVGTVYGIKGIRLKSTSLDETVKILKTAIQVQSTSDDFEWVLIFNPTVAGTPTWNNEANSSVQTATGATANTITGGTYVTGGYIGTGSAASASGQISNEIENALLLGSAIDGTPDEIWLAGRGLNNVNTLVEGSITWRELA